MPVTSLLLIGFALLTAQTNPSGLPSARRDPRELKTIQNLRPDYPIRLGGVFTRGLGEKSAPDEDSARLGIKLSDDNREWIASHCDVVGLYANTITPDTFPALYQRNRLITPLLMLYATTLYEQPDYKGSVGGWKPEMREWVLRDTLEKEVPHPDAGGHWMDFGNKAWAKYWREQASRLERQYTAQGVIANELPLNAAVETTVGLQEYKTDMERRRATYDFLRAVRPTDNYLLIPSAVGFEALTGEATLPVALEADEPALRGRVWDATFPYVQGGWSEGWLHPYWSEAALPENVWEMQVEAAERAARSGQVFLATCAYHDDAELEFGLATYLLASKRQGRVVFQPMPLRAGQPPDAGFSLATTRREVEAKSSYFNVMLGAAVQERHLIPVEGGQVWRRAFTGGAVYVNSDDRRSMTVRLGGPMLHVGGGESVREVELAPHTGVILLYPPKKK